MQESSPVAHVARSEQLDGQLACDWWADAALRVPSIIKQEHDRGLKWGYTIQHSRAVQADFTFLVCCRRR
jgi:hypothetical protein